MNTHSRRQFLAHATLPVAAAVASSIPVVVKAAEFNPDTAILAAFETYSAAYRRIDEIGDDKNPEQEAAYQVMYGAWDRIADAVPQTAAGLAAYLKVAFRNIAESMDVDNAVIYGTPLDESGLSCNGEQMLWKLIQQLEAGGVA